MFQAQTRIGDHMDHPNTRAIFEYWDTLRDGRDAPFRSEIDPRRITGALENMFILEVMPARAMRFRLAGTGLCEMIGMEARGMTLTAIVTRESADQVNQLAQEVVDRPSIGLIHAEGRTTAGRICDVEIILLPMKDEAGAIQRILGCVSVLGANRRPPWREPVRFHAGASETRAFDVEAGRGDFSVRAATYAPAAEAAAPFMRPGAGSSTAQGNGNDNAPLTAIDGNPNVKTDGERRRGHLKLVKD